MLRERPRVAIRSAIPGRERWEVDALRSEPAYCAAVERSLSRHAWTRHARANPLTGRLLVVYDRGVPHAEVRQRIESTLEVSPASPDESRAWRSAWPNGFNRTAASAAVQQARTRLILSGTLLGGVVAKRLIFGAGMFAASPALVTANAVLTIIRGYSVVTRTFDRIAAAGGFPGNTILSASHLALLVAQESIDGIAAMTIAHVGEYIEARARYETGSALQVLDEWWPRRPDASPFVRARVTSRDPFALFSDAALVSSAGMLMTTGNVDRSVAMLLGACPVAESESRITALALSLRQAVRAGILFRDPVRVSALPERAALVIDGDVIGKIPHAAIHRCGIERVVPLAPGTKIESKGVAVRELRRDGFAPIVIGGSDKRAAELLSQADLGIAFASSATPESLRVADVILLHEGVESISRALALICRTSSILRENVWLSHVAGIAGFATAMMGKMQARDASRLHNYARVAMELNSLRLQQAFS